MPAEIADLPPRGLPPARAGGFAKGRAAGMPALRLQPARPGGDGFRVLRCPECGYGFEWAELLVDRQHRHPYLFEQHPERNMRSFLMTLLGGLRPRQVLVVAPRGPLRPTAASHRLLAGRRLAHPPDRRRRGAGCLRRHNVPRPPPAASAGTDARLGHEFDHDQPATRCRPTRGSFSSCGRTTTSAASPHT